MKYNLIFTGIQEERDEDCEKVVKDFIASKLKVDGDIPIVNAHRIGNPSESRRKKLYPIAKAERRKGKKVVLVRDKLFVENEAVDPDEYPYTAPATVRPCPPPRRKRARVGSTPDNSSSFSEVRASTPYVNVS